MFHSLLFSPKLGCRSGRAACIDLLSNAAVWSNSIFQKVQYCPAETLLQHQNWLHDKRPFFIPFMGLVSLLPGGDLTFSVLQYLVIHPQNWHSLSKRELLEQRRKWVLAGGWNSSGVTHGDGVGGAWPPPHQPPISGFHIFGNYM